MHGFKVIRMQAPSGQSIRMEAAVCAKPARSPTSTLIAVSAISLLISPVPCNSNMSETKGGLTRPLATFGVFPFDGIHPDDGALSGLQAEPSLRSQRQYRRRALRVQTRATCGASAARVGELPAKTRGCKRCCEGHSTRTNVNVGAESTVTPRALRTCLRVKVLPSIRN